MSYTHEEACLNQDYMNNCYAPRDMIHNRGKLLLVSPDFFPVANKLMNAVAAAVTEGKLTLKGKKAMKEGRQAIMNNDDIKQSFMDFCVGYEVENDTKKAIWKALVDKSWNALVDKVCNARFGAVLKVHKDRTTGRAGSKRSDMALRAERKAESKKPKKSERQAKRKPVLKAAPNEPPHKKAKPEDKLETPKKSNDGAAE